MNHFHLGEMELFNLFVLENFSTVMWFFFFFWHELEWSVVRGIISF